MANASMEDLMRLVAGKRAEIKARSGSFNNAAKIPLGKSRWRILPSWRGDFITFSHDFGQHFVKDADGNVKAVLVCEHETFGGHCPHCDLVADAIRSCTDDNLVKIMREWKARKIYLVNALRMDGADADASKPILLGMTTTAMDQYLQLMMERNNDDINILSLEEGRDVIISREGQGINTRYNVNDAAKSTKVDPSVMEKLINIDDWITTEKTRGQAKAAQLAATRAMLLGTSAPASRIVTPVKAIAAATTKPLVPSSRVIEEDEPPVDTVTEEEVAVVDVSEDELVSATSSMDDDALAKLLDDLD